MASKGKKETKGKAINWTAFDHAVQDCQSHETNAGGKRLALGKECAALRSLNIKTKGMATRAKEKGALDISESYIRESLQGHDVAEYLKENARDVSALAWGRLKVLVSLHSLFKKESDETEKGHARQRLFDAADDAPYMGAGELRKKYLKKKEGDDGNEPSAEDFANTARDLFGEGIESETFLQMFGHVARRGVALSKAPEMVKAIHDAAEANAKATNATPAMADAAD